MCAVMHEKLAETEAEAGWAYFCVRIDCRVPARYSDRSASIHQSVGAVAKLSLSCCLPWQTNGRFEVKGAGFCPTAITQRKLLTLPSSSLSHGVLYISLPASYVSLQYPPKSHVAASKNQGPVYDLIVAMREPNWGDAHENYNNRQIRLWIRPILFVTMAHQPVE